MSSSDKTYIYLDYAASAPVADEVAKAMAPYPAEHFGNARSLHLYGQKACSAIDGARETIAKEIKAGFDEIIFTGSATEANNHILRGAVRSFPKPKIPNLKPRIIISAIEHESVFETAEDLERSGVDVVVVPVTQDGVVDVVKLKESLNENTVIVSVIYASNVIGVIQPIDEIARIIREFKEKSGGEYPIFHSDGAQAFQFIKMDMEKTGIDALTLSAQKIYGPKGVGALALKKKWHTKVAPLITGGTQEFGQRAGTQNTTDIVGFGKATELTGERRDERAKKIGGLRDMFWSGMQKIVPGAELNGSLEKRLPNNLHISFPGRDNQELLIKFDQAGIGVSIGSACSIRARKASRVVAALGLGEERATNCLRFSLGEQTTEGEIEEALKRIGKSLPN